MTPRDSQGDTLYTLHTWSHNRFEEIQGLLLFTASALVISGARRPEGELGRLALEAVRTVGLGVLYPALVLGLWGLRKFLHRPAYGSRLELASWLLTLPFLLAGMEGLRHASGGRVGFWFWNYLRVLLGPPGAVMVVATATIIGCCVCLELSPRQLGRRLLRLARQVFLAPLLGLLRALGWAVGGLQHGIHLLLRDLWVILNLVSGGGPEGPEAQVPGEPGTPPPTAAAVLETSLVPVRLGTELLGAGSTQARRAASLRREAAMPAMTPAEVVLAGAFDAAPVRIVSTPFAQEDEDEDLDGYPEDCDDHGDADDEDMARGAEDSEGCGEELEDEEALPTRLEVSRPLDEMPSSQEVLEEARAEERRRREGAYRMPPLELFNAPPGDLPRESDEELERKAELITTTLGHFSIESAVTRVTCGPSITQFELKPAAGVKLSKLTSLADDLAMSLAVAGVRIEAPIPGRGAVGIEVPNKTCVPVFFQEMAAQREFRSSDAPLTYVLGKSISGKPIMADLHKAPHMLVAGATGAGKSVCMNAIITSLLLRNSPERLKLILVDPKMVEMMIYDGIAHLVTPVITDPKAASAALQWAVMEMERRYKLLSKAGYRNISGFNKAVEAGEVTSESVGGPPDDSRFGPLPYMVIVIDELADLMMVAAKDIEDSICRLAQMARAVGMHLIVATQRPSTNVITGIIKANLPTRIAFRVASKIDSKVILDHMGAEALLGRGDMLYHPVGQPKPVRVQGALIEEDEIKRLVTYIKRQREPDYEDIVATVQEGAGQPAVEDFQDEYLRPCIQFVFEKGEVSTSLLQRHFKIGYNRAATIIDVMEGRGIISGPESGRRRKLVVGGSELAQILESLP